MTEIHILGYYKYMLALASALQVNLLFKWEYIADIKRKYTCLRLYVSVWHFSLWVSTGEKKTKQLTLAQ